MLEGKVVWDQCNRSLILHSKTFCKFVIAAFFLALWENGNNVACHLDLVNTC